MTSFRISGNIFGAFACGSRKWLRCVLQVRVLDCYFVEGPKVLYRVALAVLNLFSKHSSSGESRGGLSGAPSLKMNLPQTWDPV